MSLQADVQKLLDYVNAATKEFVIKNNGGVMPSAEEILAHGDSYEFPELSVGSLTSSFFTWKKSAVLVFHVDWAKNGTTITSTELTPEQWPMPLKLKLAQSIEVRAPDGSTKKIL